MARSRFTTALVLWIVLLGLSVAGSARADEELDFGLQERRLREVSFEGNEAFDDEYLRGLLFLRGPSWYSPFGLHTYRRDRLEQGIESIRGLYRRNGYHSVRVRLLDVVEHDRDGDQVSITVSEGAQTLLDEVTIVNPEPFTREQLLPLLAFREGGPAPSSSADLGSDLYRLLDAYISRGHLGARVREDLNRSPDATKLRYIVRSGPVYSIRRIDVEGNDRVREQFIRRELVLRIGERFDARRAALSEADLLDTGWFRDVSFEPAELDTIAGEATLKLHVVERPTAFWEIGPGTGSKERIRLSAGWGDHNVFRSGRGLTARARVLGVFEGSVEDADQRELYIDHEEEMTYRHPHLFGSKYSVNSTLFYQEESRPRSALELQRLGLLFNTALFTGHFSSVEIELASARTRKFSLSDKIQFTNARATTRSLALVIGRDSRNDLFDPSRGRFQQLFVQTAGGPVLQGDNDFNKALGSVAQYVQLPLGAVLAVRGQVGWVEAWGGSSDADGPTRGVPIEERFFAGGSNTVRGYRESALGPRLDSSDFETVQDPRFLVERLSGGGNAMLLLNAELRIPLPLLSRWGFLGVGFFDSGNVWRSWAHFEPSTVALSGDVVGEEAENAYRTSYGFGIHYRTIVGPLRLEYGIPLRRATVETVDDTGELVETDVDPQHVWHFSLGHAF